MLKQLLTLALVVLAFVATCTAQPVSVKNVNFNYTLVENVKRNSMKCITIANNVKVCTDTGKDKIYGMTMDKVNNVFAGSLPTKKFREYQFCTDSVGCGSMKSITGTEFIPKNYESVAKRARQHWLNTVSCIGDGSMGLDYFYPTAVDITMPKDNFQFSWWITSLPLFHGKCN